MTKLVSNKKVIFENEVVFRMERQVWDDRLHMDIMVTMREYLYHRGAVAKKLRENRKTLQRMKHELFHKPEKTKGTLQ